MYNTIRQQHIIDRTEQERLLLSFIAQRYYKTKYSITERRNAQNDALETQSHSTQAAQPSESA